MPRKKLNSLFLDRATPLFWVLLIVVVLGLSFGGVSAYLTWSSAGVENQFSIAENPVVQVNPDYSITVHNPGYAVYLRAAVVVNWENNDNTTIVADMPVAKTDSSDNGDYSITLGDNWKPGADGFYYYKDPIICGSKAQFQTAPVVKEVNQLVEKNGYHLKITILAQTIQAVGSTDPVDSTTPTEDAVEDAWGVTPDETTAP